MLAVNMNEGVTKQHPRGLFRCPYLCLTLPLDNAAQTQGGTSEKNSFHLEPILQCSTCVVFYIETQKKKMITGSVGDDRMLLVVVKAICAPQKRISTVVIKRFSRLHSW